MDFPSQTTPKKEQIPYHSSNRASSPTPAKSDPYFSSGQRTFFTLTFLSDHFFSYVSHRSAIRPNFIDRVGNDYPSQVFVLFWCWFWRKESQTRSYFWPLPPKSTHPPRILIILFFYSFLHVLLSPNEGTTAGLFILISILNKGGDWAEIQAQFQGNWDVQRESAWNHWCKHWNIFCSAICAICQKISPIIMATPRHQADAGGQGCIVVDSSHIIILTKYEKSRRTRVEWSRLYCHYAE